MAAEKMTVAIPVGAQMKITIRRNVLNPGAGAGGVMLPMLRSTSQILSPLPPRLAGNPGIAFATWLTRPTLNGGPA